MLDRSSTCRSTVHRIKRGLETVVESSFKYGDSPDGSSNVSLSPIDKGFSKQPSRLLSRGFKKKMCRTYPSSEIAPTSKSIKREFKLKSEERKNKKSLKQHKKKENKQLI